MTTKVSRIDLGCRRRKRRKAHHSGTFCHGSGCQIDVIGAGREDYPLPTVSDLVSRALARSASRAITEGTTGSGSGAASEPLGAEFWKDVRSCVPRIEADPGNSDQLSMTGGSEGLRKLMAERRFDGLVDVRFSPMIGAVNWARANMPKGFRKPIISLARQITRLKNKYKKAIRKLHEELSERRPEASFDELVAEATELLDQEMEELLGILTVYTDSLAQYRDGVYTRELELVNFFFEQSATLFHTIDPTDEDDADNRTSRQLNTSAFKVGDRYVARIVAGELSTIPGSLGPVGLHSLELPVEMVDFMFLLLPILAHELFHDIYYDVKGLEEELTEKVKKAIRRAVAKREVTFSREEIQFGAGSVKTLDLLEKLYVDLLSEIAADVCGGVLLSGPAFLASMLASFPAMGMGDTKTTDAARMLWTRSEYHLEEKGRGRLELTFEPHPVDFVRVLGLAEVLRQLGFASEAERYESLAAFGAGEGSVGLPEFITYSDASGTQPEMLLQLPVEDINKLMPVVARVLLSTKLKSLGQRSMLEMYNWTEARQETVSLLVKQLVAGKYAIPKKAGKVYATYVGAAAPLAYWELVASGRDPVKAARKVNRLAMRMLGTVRRRFEQ